MMKAIHKYTINPHPGVQQIKVRKNARLLKTAEQGNLITFWYEVDTHESWIYVHFLIYTTGQELDNELHNKAQYVDTLLFNNGAYVLHVYLVAISACA